VIASEPGPDERNRPRAYQDGRVDIRVEPATPQRWADVGSAFGTRGARPDSCWCQRFRRHTEADNRTALHREITEAQVPIGLLAYVDDSPAGWTRVVPRRALHVVRDNRAIRRLLDEADAAWWISCFAINPAHRNTGVGTALLRAAITHARENGAAVLDGHPVDVDRLGAKASPSALFTGTLAMFQAAGFHEIGRTYPSRPVMRIDLR
jgi:GNAT superfamily N-acetyltransferase